MGLEAGTGWLIASMLGSQGLGAALAPEGTELQGFDGEGDQNPRGAMQLVRDLLGDEFNRSLHRAYVDPQKIETTVNPLPSFVGGGLPMAIGVPGQDERRLKKRYPTIGQGTGTNVGGSGGNDAQQAAAALGLVGGGRA